MYKKTSKRFSKDQHKIEFNNMQDITLVFSLAACEIYLCSNWLDWLFGLVLQHSMEERANKRKGVHKMLWKQQEIHTRNSWHQRT